jgi:hypothetical protein
MVVKCDIQRACVAFLKPRQDAVFRKRNGYGVRK